MTTILCATRGGEASIPAQRYAIKLAKEQNAEIAFLYITDVQFLIHATGTATVDVATELDHMGEFLLLMAQERAAKEGVTSTIHIERGVFREALIRVAEELEAVMVVIGTPDEGNITAQEHLESVAAAIKEELGIETHITDGIMEE